MSETPQMPSEEGSPVELLKPGWMVILVTTPGTSPHAVPNGEVQAVGDRGVRITLMDWLVGAPVGDDFFVPWRNIEAASVWTGEHSLKDFSRVVERWQAWAKEAGRDEQQAERTKPDGP